MQEKIKIRWIEFLLGLAILALTFGFTLYFFLNINTTASTTIKNNLYTAYFSNVGNLRQEDPVKIGGVQVGVVRNISVDTERLLPKVEFWVSTQINLPVNSKVRILNTGILGGKYLGIEPGDSNEFLTENGEFKDSYDAQSIEDIISRAIFIVQKVASKDIGTGQP